MKVVLSPNPYRDRGLKTALRAREVLARCGIETALCLPFSLDQGARMDLPKGQDYRNMQEELKTADFLLCFFLRKISRFHQSLYSCFKRTA